MRLIYMGISRHGLLFLPNMLDAIVFLVSGYAEEYDLDSENHATPCHWCPACLG